MGKIQTSGNSEKELWARMYIFSTTTTSQSERLQPSSGLRVA